MTKWVNAKGGWYYSVVNRQVVTERNTSPGRSTVEGKSGWFGLFGKCWVSRHMPVRRACGCALQVVAAVQLHRRLGGGDLHATPPAATRAANAGAGRGASASTKHWS